jgi:ribonuclease BN (tRNA processing enzyme)
MSNKDYRKRETKKPKKDAKKITKLNIEPTVNVEVIKKGKKNPDFE